MRFAASTRLTSRRFIKKSSKLQARGQNQRRNHPGLEWMNIGRLRVASKGLDRVQQESASSKLASLPDDEQFARGMYMIGQVASMHDRVITMDELHREVCEGSARVAEQLAPEIGQTPAAEKPCDIAVIGMSCFLSREPRASGSIGKTFWIAWMPSPKFPKPTGIGGCITIPIPGRKTKSSPSGAGSWGTSPSIRCNTASRPRA